MPNQFQLAFLASFSVTLVVLVLLSQFITTKLREAGYPISHLILIGLDKKDNNSGDMSTTSSNSPAIFFAVFFVLLSAIYAKFTYKGLFLSFFFSPGILTITQGRTQGRSKPLDPNNWKEFPLERKTQVSPNTAMCVKYNNAKNLHLLTKRTLQLPFQTPSP